MIATLEQRKQGFNDSSVSDNTNAPNNNRLQCPSTPKEFPSPNIKGPILKIWEILDQITDLQSSKHTNYNYDYRELQRQPHARFDERYNHRYSPPVFPLTPSLNSSFPEALSRSLLQIAENSQELLTQ